MARFEDETRRLMDERGWTMRRLAREAHVDYSDLSKMLRGLKTPSPMVMATIDTALGARGTILDSEAPRVQGKAPGLPRRMLTEADAGTILATLATFRHLDSQAGGGHTHALAVAYLESTVTPMVRSGTYGEQAGRALFGAAAQAAHLAGWTAYDNSDLKNADKYLARALELAAAAGDDAFTGEVLAARSHQAIHVGEPHRAVELARAARHAAPDTPALAAEAWELEANGHALLADRTACATALTACEQALDRVIPGAVPPWLSYIGPAYIAARVAHTLRDLGDWDAARARSLEAAEISGTLARAGVFNTLICATTWVQADRDAAISDGRAAVALTEGIQSGRATAYTGDLRRRLRRRYGSSDPAVAAFDEECRNQLGR
jgi:transcriptional regulator with XRE-family HTH domain